MALKIKILALLYLCLAPSLIIAAPENRQDLAAGAAANISQSFCLPENKSISLSMGDITKKMGKRRVKTAIVSAANKYLDYVTAGGVAGAIGQMAGREELQAQARAQAGRQQKESNIFCEPGRALLTETSGLANKRFKNQHIDAIIHAVGPDCRVAQENQSRAALLNSVYGRIFDQAEAAGIQKLYLPGISIAIFACPIQEATPIAIRVAVERLKASDRLKAVEFVLFDQNTYDVYSAHLAKKLTPSMWQKFKSFWGF